MSEPYTPALAAIATNPKEAYEQITTLEEEVKALTEDNEEAKQLQIYRYEEHQKEVGRYREALESIANDPHCDYFHKEVQGAGQYSIGIADGHRCSAAKAKEALNDQSSPKEEK